MADVFVSYAKTDRSLASTLVAMLEAEGWTVWWDTSLAAADLYRDEIMKQLAAARAVITIWTPNSIRSDWVRAEAGTAKNEGKLIPVKTPDVAYADIPLPFGEMHTENLESSELIRAAVVAQLAKPAVEPTAAALLTKGFKYELLTWVGIVGGALTLFTNITAVLKLADWARDFVQGWKEWTHAFWVWAFGWLGIHLPPGSTPLLSFLLFGSLLTIGQAVKFKRAIKTQTIDDKYQGMSFGLISWRTLFCIVTLIVVVWCMTFIVDDWFIPIADWLVKNSPGFMTNRRPYVVLAMLVVPPALLVVMFARVRLHAAVTISLMVIFWIIITFNQLFNPTAIDAIDPFAALAAFIMLPVLLLILLSVAPARAISRRLIFLAIGLVLLIALNELSKLGIDLTTPKLQG
jgi:hypothetical protein